MKRHTEDSLSGMTMELRCYYNIWNIYVGILPCVKNKENVQSELFGKQVQTKEQLVFCKVVYKRVVNGAIVCLFIIPVEKKNWEHEEQCHLLDCNTSPSKWSSTIHYKTHDVPK